MNSLLHGLPDRHEIDTCMQCGEEIEKGEGCGEFCTEKCKETWEFYNTELEEELTETNNNENGN